MTFAAMLLQIRYFVALVSFVCLTVKTSAQYSDSVHHYIRYASTGSINRTDAASAYLLNNAFKFGIRQKRIALNVNSAWVYGQQNNVLTNNDVTTALDFNVYMDPPRLYYWGLANYTSSYSLKIVNQYQTGAGAAYSILDKPNAYLNVSDGILYEGSDIILKDSSNEVYNTFRNSFRLSFQFIIKNVVTINNTSFLQNSLQYEHDYIIRSTSALSLKLNKWLSITTSLTYNKISRTEKENLLFVYGLTAEKYF